MDPSSETYFITIVCRPRGLNHLARPEVAERLFETVQHREENRVWWPSLFLLMPDHLHAIFGFPHSGKPMGVVIAKWKEWTAKTLAIAWQDDFFERRLRDDDDRREKADYILANPVRAGLVARAEDWPHVYFGGEESNRLPGGR